MCVVKPSGNESTACAFSAIASGDIFTSLNRLCFFILPGILCIQTNEETNTNKIGIIEFVVSLGN